MFIPPIIIRILYIALPPGSQSWRKRQIGMLPDLSSISFGCGNLCDGQKIHLTWSSQQQMPSFD